jgi:hypothetical protein
MNRRISILTRLGLLKEDPDYHVIRASMVIIFLFFGYQKWFDAASLQATPSERIASGRAPLRDL